MCQNTFRQFIDLQLFFQAFNKMTTNFRQFIKCLKNLFMQVIVWMTMAITHQSIFSTQTSFRVASGLHTSTTTTLCKALAIT
jgi:hypothetical protein